jgi:vacuolar-type H+-ATPase subunit I/STV1
MLPESCFLIIIGTFIGVITYLWSGVDEADFVLNSNAFFLYILPPIILEAGYFMPNR